MLKHPKPEARPLMRDPSSDFRSVRLKLKRLRRMGKKKLYGAGLSRARKEMLESFWDMEDQDDTITQRPLNETSQLTGISDYLRN